MPKLDEHELTAILAAEKRDALSADQAAKLSEERERGMDYYNGDMAADMPSQPDRSKAVSHDVLDVVEGLMPSLMEIFCSGDEVVKFNPVGPEDEEAAQQETDYVNHVFLQKNEGFTVAYSFVKDALLSKNGIVKVFWETKEIEERETYLDQSHDVYALIMADPELEIVEHTEHPPEYSPPLVPLQGGGGVPGPSDPGNTRPLGPPRIGEPGMNPNPMGQMGPTMPGPGAMGNPPIGMGPPPASRAGPPVGPGGGAVTGAPPGPPAPGGPPTPQPPGRVGPPGAPPPPPEPDVGEMMTAIAMSGPTHDFTVVQKRKYGCCRVEPVPPEEFGVSRRAKLGQPLDYSYHQVQRTVAQLIDMGFDEAQLEDLPDSPPDENMESIARDTVEDDRAWSSSVNKATRLITVTEHYATLDYDGDGPRLYRVTTAGGSDGQILKRDGELDIIPVEFDPFAVTTPLIVTHRFFGKSMPDLTMDIQRVKTALVRGMLDNVYLANNQRLEIAESHSGPNTIDDMLNNRPGGMVRTKQPGGLLPIPNQNLGEYVYPAIEYMDTTREWRTGVVRQGQGIDADALQNQSATAVKQVYNAAQAKNKLVARIMAETGFKQLFHKMHATIRKNEGAAQTVKLRNQWVTVNPREWKRRDDLTISVGLGSGGKAEQLAFWGQVLLMQKEALGLPGQNIVKPANIYAALQKFMELGGERSVETFFSDPDASPPGEVPPDPKMIEVQGKLQMQKVQMQADQQKMQADAQMKQAETQAKAEIEKLQAQADVASNDRKVQADIALAQKKFELERDLAILKFRLDSQIAQEKAKQRPQSTVATSSDGEEVAVTPIDEIVAPMNDAIGRLGESLGQMQAQTTQAILAALQTMGQSVNAPKRVVRDPKTNRVVGVETVTNGDARQ